MSTHSGGTFWTLDRVAAALGPLAVAAPRGSAPLAGVSTDTRTLRPGELFVVLSGERFDAHDFLRDAVARGAAALVVSRPERAAGLGVPVFAVDDTLVALGALGRYRRRAWSGPLVCVAGSNGKTTTKDLIAGALGARLVTHATSGNLNNLVGAPLTLLAIPDPAEVAVVEVGTNAPGEVARLRAMCEPDVAVITSVGEEHLEGLGSLDAVLREEVSVADGVATAIVPASQPDVVDAARRHARTVIAAGLDAGDVRAERWGMGGDGLGWIEYDGATVRPPARGAHNLRNTMIALAVARVCGVSASDAARGIAAARLSAMRSAWEPHGRALVINDAYNANPASMRAALELLAGADGGSARQRVAILGTMRELGAAAPRLHAEMAAAALAQRIDLVAGVGEMATALREAPGASADRVVTAPDVADLWSALEPRLAADAIILLKASRGVRLERLLPLLSAWADRTCSTTS
ncbi:MAG TPA: UDP-N-acetylmuramoyl-tripeptide--D-alanyl-D-alanine ligase [Gemmatimonadaceae bacterium]|nr:UDP-N-acetylmuramoyl-tripeptide--D-alanyl-D-alanine ligase [Gemmatimonadaceae bacterium]